MSMSSNMALIIRAECDEYILIFEYSNILVTNIYSDIRLYPFFFYEFFGHSFVANENHANIFGFLFMSVHECHTLVHIVEMVRHIKIK